MVSNVMKYATAITYRGLEVRGGTHDAYEVAFSKFSVPVVER